MDRRLRISAIALLFVCTGGATLFGFSRTAEAGYGETAYYAQSTYYGQSAYYAQGSYESSYATRLTDSTTITGQASILGALSKGSGTFVIDHPLDPKNLLLYHSFVESPDVKNLYDGVTTLDQDGSATIVLPAYFLALNKDFRYLATPLSSPMPNLHLTKAVHREWRWFGDIVFSIGGGTPGGKVSWQVTGIRHDPLILRRPLIPEVLKTETTIVPKGTCIFEPLCK